MFLVVLAWQMVFFALVLLVISSSQAHGLVVEENSLFTETGNTTHAAPPFTSGSPWSLPAPSVSVRNTVVECNSRQYGRPIASSCLDAWRLMPSEDREVTFADRVQRIASEVVLPWRFPSCKRLRKSHRSFGLLNVVCS